MTGPGQRPEPDLPSTNPATADPGTGEGAQTALLALIKKRKLSSQPEGAGEVPEPPPGPASDS
jgi:hypothetical protein